jgi:hypothetical protein
MPIKATTKLMDEIQADPIACQQLREITLGISKDNKITYNDKVYVLSDNPPVKNGKSKST